jgi:DNA-directed RNA polymerase subunit RPC12/RpoP
MTITLYTLRQFAENTPLICPRCKTPVRTLSVRTAFMCVRCGGKLQSNHRAVLGVAFLLGVIAEGVLFVALRLSLGSTVAAVYAWLIIGGLVGLLLYWLVIRAFCRVILWLKSRCPGIAHLHLAAGSRATRFGAVRRMARLNRNVTGQ